MSTEVRYLTPQQMADETGFPVESIRVALRNGEMYAVRMGKGRSRGYFVGREVVEQWLIDREQTGKTAK